MSVFHNNALIGSGAGTGAAAAAEYVIPKSLRFNSGDSGSLSKTFATTGNRKTWTWSAWVKRSGNNNGGLFGNYYSDDSFGTLFFNSDQLQFSANTTWFKTTQVFRDFSSFFHIVLAVDTTLATAGDRVRLYINGSEVTDFATENNPSQYANLGPDNSAETRIGRDGSNYFNGLLADIQFVDGQQLAPTDFGETRSSDGVWVPKEFAGTFSSDPVTIQVGSPSYPSDFTTTGNKTSDQTGLSFGSWSGTYTGANTKIFKASDDSVFSILVDTTGRNDDRLLWYSDNLTDWTYIGNGNAFSPPYTLSGHKYYCTSEGAGDVTLHVSNPTFNSFHLNFSDSSTNEALGFDSAPTIPDLDPKKGFDVVTYSGNGGTQNIGGLGFEPGLIWAKTRNHAVDHKLTDNVRGSTKVLGPNVAQVESTDANGITSFDPGGFSIGSSNDYNNGSRTYVAWCWKAGDAVVANTTGTIDSQVSVNTDYGLSIVSYTGNNTAGATVGHGLGSVPKFILVKNRDSTSGWWAVYHASQGNTKGAYLNDSQAFSTQSFWNDTTPTSSVFSLGANANTNANGNDFMAYLWSEISGFSKFGSYTGTGAAGVSVTTGFKPRWVLIKEAGNSNHYYIYDTERGVTNILWASSSATESDIGSGDGSNQNAIEVSDTGFSIPHTLSGTNRSGGTFIYAAFGDRPGNHFDVNNIVTNEGLTTSKSQFDIVAYTGNGATLKLGGAVYSDAVPTADGFRPGRAAADGFDGSLSTYVAVDNTTFNLNVGSWGLSGTLEVYTGSNHQYAVDGGSASSMTADDWTNVGDAGSITTLTLTRTDGNYPYFYAVRVGGTTLIDGTGPGLKFQPDLVWVKNKDQSEKHVLTDSVRGIGKALYTSSTSAEDSGSTYSDRFVSFNSDGFTVGSSHTTTNSSGDDFVAYCWKAGGTAVSNTDGSITSSVSANADYGFSIVTYTGSAGGTVGHGLGKVPKLIIAKSRTQTKTWPVYTSVTGKDQYLVLNDTNAVQSASGVWGSAEPTSAVFGIENSSTGGNVHGDIVAYCFADVPGYQRIGSVDTGSDPIVITGFKPRFLLTKKIQGSEHWFLHDSERDSDDDDNTTTFEVNNNNASESGSARQVKFLDNGFQLIGGDVDVSGGTTIYLAIGDDEIGSDEDCLVDVPNAVTADADATDTTGGYQRGNYATINPLSKDDSIYYTENGNLVTGNNSVSSSSSGSRGRILSTIGFKTGKWYAEVQTTAASDGDTDFAVGIFPVESTGYYSTSGHYALRPTGHLYSPDGIHQSYGTGAWTDDDIIGIAVDMDSSTKTIQWFKNGTAIASATTIVDNEYFFGYGSDGGGGSRSYKSTWNFGQQRFKYPIPDGYAALNTTALPAATIEDGSAHFATSLWTVPSGSADTTISGLSFAPDLVWTKNRSQNYEGSVYDTVRGDDKYLKLFSSSATAAEATAATRVNLTSDGFVLEADNDNSNYTAGSASVGWAWNAGTSTASNTDGSKTSSVRANQTAGFSIVTFSTGLDGVQSIGHGLNAVPEFVITKQRNATSNWIVYHKHTTGYDKIIRLNLNDALVNLSTAWGSSSNWTNTTFGINTSTVQTGDVLAYCFAPVAGYSHFTTFEGTGSSDPVFVYCGFRPRWILRKNADTDKNWYLHDTARDTFNVCTKEFQPHNNSSEGNHDAMDILSNGFAMRTSNAQHNNSGSTHLVAAFAENPFQANGGLAR